jgi:hypothetical protein
MRIITYSYMPDKYLDDWLRMLKQFDDSHATCDIKSEVIEGNMSVEEVSKIMEPYYPKTIIMMKGRKNGMEETKGRNSKT